MCARSCDRLHECFDALGGCLGRGGTTRWETALVMPAKQEISSFVRSTFRSVWALELLCFLRKNGERSWPRHELVRALRGSELVVAQSVESLLAAGLVVVEADRSPAEVFDGVREALEKGLGDREDGDRTDRLRSLPSDGTEAAEPGPETFGEASGED